MNEDISQHEPFGELLAAIQDAHRAWASATSNRWVGRDELARFDLMQVQDAADRAHKAAAKELGYVNDEDDF